MSESEFILECEKLGIDINLKIEELNKYKVLLQNWNEKFNLTTIIEDSDIYLKHFFDSLCINKAYDFKENTRICDFGTGAGFPGMVLAIVFGCKTTLIESNGKKCDFLKEVINCLNLKNVEIVNLRSEDYAKNNREKFDIVTCRAVSALPIVLELAIPMIKVDGYFIPLKSNVDEEILKSKEIMLNIKCNIEKIIEYELPVEKSKRTILKIVKNESTNMLYPRNYNVIIKSNK